MYCKLWSSRNSSSESLWEFIGGVSQAREKSSKIIGPAAKHAGHHIGMVPESTTTRKAGGLDFTAIGGKGGARSAPIVAGLETQSYIGKKN
jgi:hypothetical protein